LLKAGAGGFQNPITKLNRTTQTGTKLSQLASNRQIGKENTREEKGGSGLYLFKGNGFFQKRKTQKQQDPGKKTVKDPPQYLFVISHLTSKYPQKFWGA
jgi:hypothetical protein